MPTPNKGEKRSEFVSRAIDYYAKEMPQLSAKARVGRAEGVYDSWLKKKGKSRRILKG